LNLSTQGDGGFAFRRPHAAGQEPAFESAERVRGQGWLQTFDSRLLNVRVPRKPTLAADFKTEIRHLPIGYLPATGYQAADAADDGKVEPAYVAAADAPGSPHHLLRGHHNPATQP